VYFPDVRDVGMTKVLIQLPVCQFCSLCARCQWQRRPVARTTVYMSKEFRQADCRYHSYIMLYIARKLATAKFCNSTPCRLVNSYAYTNTDGVISHNYMWSGKYVTHKCVGTGCPSFQSFQAVTEAHPASCTMVPGSSLYP
jgi:hypothetical protein